MSMPELLQEVRSPPRPYKFHLMPALIAELAQEEGIGVGEYSIWSPYDAHPAAVTVLELLEAERRQSAFRSA